MQSGGTFYIAWGHPTVFTSVNNSNTKPKKAAARYQAVACNHAQARPTYLAHAKNIVKLAERCVFQLKRDQLRSGFSYEMRFSYLYR